MQFEIEKVGENKVTLQPAGGSLDDMELRKRLHDASASMRTIKLCINGIENGYKFDDDAAPAKLKALTQACDRLTEEVDFLERVYGAFVEV